MLPLVDLKKSYNPALANDLQEKSAKSLLEMGFPPKERLWNVRRDVLLSTSLPSAAEIVS